jgi:hypothetical protein
VRKGGDGRISATFKKGEYFDACLLSHKSHLVKMDGNGRFKFVGTFSEEGNYKELPPGNTVDVALSFYSIFF